jgi:AcrR family transcriptional regulator
MDIRIFKTKQQIKEAFIKLREKDLPERIKVKDICATADINKTTFYKHYVDSYDLLREIEDACVDRVVNGFAERDDLLKSPAAYLDGLSRSVQRELGNLKAVYHDRGEVLCAKLEERLKKCYEHVEERGDKIKISFIIGGFVGVMRDNIFGEKLVELKDAVADYITYISLNHPLKRATGESN